MDESTEAFTLTDAEVDASWNGTDTGMEFEDEGEQDNAQPEADQPTTEEPTEAEATEVKEADEKQAEADQPLTFTLKHLDEVKTVGKDEIVKLAQQGMDYERIRTERDQLRDYRNEADPALNLVKAYAEQNGMTITDYVDFCRKQELMAKGIDEATATERVAVDNDKARIQAEKEAKAAEEAQTKAQQEEQQKRVENRKNEMNRFLQKFPAVKPESIPSEVWAEVAKGDSLVVAYTEHRNKQLEAELAAERQNKANKEKTTGSLSTTGAGSKQDEIDKWWNSD